MFKRKGIRFILIVTGCVFMPLLVIGQSIDGTIDQGEYPFSQSFDEGNYNLAWAVKGDVVYVAMSAETTGWVALGVDPITLMEDADIIFGWVDASGKSHILDTHSEGPYGPHPPDEELGGTQDILAFAATEREGVTTIEFSRDRATPDKYDKDLLGEDGNIIIWAYGESDNYRDYHRISGFGSIGVEEGNKVRQGVGWLLIFHNISLGVAFLLIVLAMLVARYMKKKRWWLKVHRTSMIIGVSLSLLGFISVEYILFSTSAVHLRIIHSWLGAVAMILLVCSPIFGQLILKSKRERKPFFRSGHRWLGRTAIVLTTVSIVYGLMQIQIL